MQRRLELMTVLFKIPQFALFSAVVFLGIAMLVQTSPGCRGSQGWYFLVLTGSATSQAGTQGLTEDWRDESESEEALTSDVG